ncbi:MAG: DUF4886 domain-containing protein [Oscillospiraceae bacterium]|nr:DUF4886 domain-containing protein [Oscillospiraceae bacterium]
MMKKLLSWLLVFALCLSMAACAAPAVEPEENEASSNTAGAIATATTGDVVTNITDLSELTDVVDPSGNTQIQLLQDITYNKPIRLPYSCTLDFNGFTVNTSPNDGNGVEVSQIGSENGVTTLKNGTLTQYGIGVRVNEGGIAVENMTISSKGGAAIAIFDPAETYKSTNVIKNSTLASKASCVVFYDIDVSYFKTGVTIEDSTLISHDPDGVEVFSVMGTKTTPGTITLGENVQIYSYSNTLAPKDGYTYSGKIAYRDEKVQSATVDGQSYEDLNYWSTADEKETINLLMIGNSFSYYFATELYNIANAAGVEINVTNLYKSGCTLEEHWNWLTNKDEGLGKYSYWVSNSMGRWNPAGITTSYDALPFMDWDVITLQQHFKPETTADYETAKGSCEPYAKDLYDQLKKDYPNAKLYWQQTWAYQAGHAEIPDASAQTKQQNIINQVSREICQENAVDRIPTGDAWTIARALVGDTLCLEDMYHDGDVGGGQYLNACVWFEVLTGKSCIGNTWRPSYDLSEEKITQLQLAAHQAVAECYGEDYAK